MEEFWKGIDVPAKHSSERGLRKGLELTSQNRSDYQEQSRSDLKMEFLEISLDKIIDATNNFNEECCIGKGGFAHVYKAELDVLDIQSLPSNMEGMSKEQLPKIRKVVAIKKTKDRADDQGKQVFFTEIKLLTSCKHTNILSLLGFCSEKDELILVYELALNGSLADYLENMSIGKKVNLTWAQRIQICLDVAHGISYLHTNMDGKPMIIHRDIKSDNILLNGNLNAKVGDFGLSKFNLKQQAITMYTKSTAGTDYYIDPEYSNEFKYKREIDIYSFGVVLFEVMSGRLAYDSIYTREHRMGLAPIAKRRFKEGTLKQLIDPKLIEEVRNGIFTLNREHDQDPFDAFSKIAYQCLETQANRPKMEVIIKELQTQLNLQEFKSATNNFSTILSATNNFSDGNLLTKCALGKVYKGQFLWKGNLMNFTVRRLHCKYGQGDELQTEISTLKILEHKNLISVLGQYDDNDEKIIIYEQAFHETLDHHLSDPNLTWSQRLRICLGVARTLDCIHSDVIHCDINSSKIFLDKDWEPKIYGFELSTKFPQSWRHRLLYSRYFNTNNMTPKHDVYCFGVLLFEVLRGRKPIIKDDVVQEEPDELIDTSLRKQMSTESLSRFKNIAYKCLKPQLLQRPTMDQIVEGLEKVSELQRKHENPFVVREYSNVAVEDENVREYSNVADEDEGASSNSLKVELLEIPMSEIRLATNNFDDTYSIGSGGYGKVYKANLNVLDIECLLSMKGEFKDDELPRINKTVAIKRLSTDQEGKQGFLAEIEVLKGCKHTNIVSLLGFSIEASEMILVFAYALKGSLTKHLADNFTWAQRIKICVDIAHGINYLHTGMKGKRIVHRDIKSDNILLDENLNAKLADFGISKFQPMEYQTSYVVTKGFEGTMVYLDPEYFSTGMYRKESDTYSLGVVLLEVLSGRVAYDPIYTNENEMGLAPIARRLFKEKTLMDLIDPKMIEDDDDDDPKFSLNRGPNQDSFDAFSKIAYQCLAQSRDKRPKMEVVIKELQNALNLQGDTVVLSRFRVRDIVLATENFAETCCIGLDTNGTVYKAELDQFAKSSSLATEGKNSGEPSKKRITAAIKRITNRKRGQGKQEFLEELEMRAYKHPNIVSLIGFCDESDEMMLVYEHATGRSLDDYLKSVDRMDNITWTKRVHVSLEIAHGLSHLHTKMVNQSIIRTDIKSANILLNKNGEVKIAHSMISKLHPASEEIWMKVYENPEYETTERQSDVYSFGVLLFEIFCGRVAYDPVFIKENEKGLASIARQCFNDGTIQRILDPRLKEEMGKDVSLSDNKSMDTFFKIACQCLGEAAKRPTIEMVIKELEIALNLQDGS